jgi:hypothetical protein
MNDQNTERTLGRMEATLNSVAEDVTEIKSDQRSHAVRLRSLEDTKSQARGAGKILSFTIGAVGGLVGIVAGIIGFK